MRIRISRKEANESVYGLGLLTCPDELQQERNALRQEAHELMLLFGAILRTSLARPD